MSHKIKNIRKEIIKKMKKFSSYGPVNEKIHYHAPRTELINQTYEQLIGDSLEIGHYITIWAPRQTGKTWLMLNVINKIKKENKFETGIITLQSAKNETTDKGILEIFIKNMNEWFKKDFPLIDSWKNLSDIFSKNFFEKPLILVIDEFDSLSEEYINKFANEFRDMYIKNINEAICGSDSKNYMLHGLALVGVRSVLGIENQTGSPFNVQRSVQIPNFSFEEVKHIFKSYETETRQKINNNVIKNIFYEFSGQPGLTCWFGELLTEKYNTDKSSIIEIDKFNDVYDLAKDVLPNNNILNIISKARLSPYREFLLEMFRTDEKIMFKYDNPEINFLYMNGVIEHEKADRGLNFVKFSSPYVQKRLFNYFSDELFHYLGKLVDPFENLDEIITEKKLNINRLIKRYEIYLQKNKQWLLKDAPRRKDLRIFEAVYHFNLFMYLHNFLTPKNASIYPEFPTGNGKIDIIIKYAQQTYGIEIKTFTDEGGYKTAISQAARYGLNLSLSEISLIFFVEYIDDSNRLKFETDYFDEETSVVVLPVFVATGN